MIFGKPKLPVESKMRDWVDNSMRRFVEMFGSDCALRPVVTPTPSFFPGEYSEALESAQALFDLVCTYMDVSKTVVKLVVFNDEELDQRESLRKALPTARIDRSGAAGLYRHEDDDDKALIVIERRQFADLGKTIATMAHELGHVLLLSGGKIGRDDADMEPLTDLITVFKGLGIFSANSAMNFEQHSAGGYHGWSVQKLGYLAEPTYGYALANYAKMRGEHNPSWKKYLDKNVRVYFEQSTAVLEYERKHR